MAQRYCEKCGGKDFVDGTAGHFCGTVYVQRWVEGQESLLEQMTKHEKEGQLGEECCVKCLWGYSSGETKCIKEECACHTLNFPRREEHCHLCQPSEEKEERNNFGNCIYCGLKECSHQPSEEKKPLNLQCTKCGFIGGNDGQKIMNHACSEEKKDWEEQFDEKWHSSSFGENPDGVKSFIREKLKEQSNTFQKQVNEHCNKRVDAEIALKEEREILAGAIEMSKQGWIDEGRNEMRLKNAGLYRQLFGETNNIYTSKDLWEIFDNYQPLFTEEQKKELKDNLNLIMK